MKEGPKELTKEEREKALRDWQVLKSQGRVFDAKDVMELQRKMTEARDKMKELKKTPYASFSTEKGEEFLHEWKNINGKVLYREELRVVNLLENPSQARIVLRDEKSRILAVCDKNRVLKGLESELNDKNDLVLKDQV